MRAVIALFLLVFFSAGAYAQSCQALRGQLQTAQAGKPNRAVIAALERRASSYGCNKNARSSKARMCPGITAQIRQAKAGGVNRSRVRRLKQQISRFCDTEQGRQAWFKRREGPRRETKGNRRNIFSSIFGRQDDREVDVASVNPSRGAQDMERVELDPGSYKRAAKGTSASGPLATRTSGRRKGSSREGHARTMCVRLCDGFYFPINSRSHSDNYYDELAMCVGRCPGSDVSLYVHYQGEPVERMRSAMTGEAYVNLPTAFNYRKTLSPRCGCANGTQIVRGGDKPHMSLASAAPLRSQAGPPKDQARWTPFRAVYDGTGSEISPSLTVYGSKVSIADANRGARRTPANQSVATGMSVALPSAAAPGPGMTFDPKRDTVRAVGPQFFSRAVIEFAEAKETPRVAPQVPQTSITVTPLRSVPEGERADADAAQHRVDASQDDIVPGTSAMVKPAGTGG